VESKNYFAIVSHYESCLDRHGDTHLGVDWPKEEDAATRYQVMLEVIKPGPRNRPVRLLDFGCGASHLYEYIQKTQRNEITYVGLDLSEKFVSLARSKFPENQYYCVDLLDEGVSIPRFDYIVLNGVLTEKQGLSFEEMFSYFTRLLREVFAYAEIGLAFNVMSKHVDWERDDLFHLPFDTLAAFLKKELTENFVIRNDYGFYEYTTYVYR
jgi:SAM-dependent methyltransferase